MSYIEVLDYCNLLNSGKRCLRSGRWKSSIQKFEVNMTIETSQNKKRLLSDKITFYKTNNFVIFERGKTRKIKAHHIKDRQILKSFCTYELKPTIKTRIIPNNAASQIGKGTDYSIKHFREDLAHMVRKYGKDFYVGIGDLHDYFATENHNIIESSIIFKNSNSNNILHSYLNCFDGDSGVGIGGEPSQDISIVYTSPIMRMLLCNRKVERCGIYMDDFYFMCKNRDDARYAMKCVRKQAKNLKLTINEKRTKINHMTKDSVAWLKKRTYISDTGKIIMRLSRSNIKSAKRRLKYYKENNVPIENVNQSILCWCSYARPYNSKQELKKMVEYYAKLFDIPKSKYNVLFKKHPKGFINNSKKKSLRCLERSRHERMKNILFS